jgi:hypothetical protein
MTMRTFCDGPGCQRTHPPGCDDGDHGWVLIVPGCGTGPPLHACSVACAQSVLLLVEAGQALNLSYPPVTRPPPLKAARIPGPCKPPDPPFRAVLGRDADLRWATWRTSWR